MSYLQGHGVTGRKGNTLGANLIVSAWFKKILPSEKFPVAPAAGANVPSAAPLAGGIGVPPRPPCPPAAVGSTGDRSGEEK